MLYQLSYTRKSAGQMGSGAVVVKMPASDHTPTILSMPCSPASLLPR